MPVRNAQAYLPDAIGSIIAQTYTDFELIIADDGSSDNSPAIARQWAQRDGRVVLLELPPAGYLRALKKAVVAAKGSLLARMDADDISMPQRFARQVAYLDEHPKCVLVGANVITMDQDAALIGVMPDIVFGHEAIDQALLRRGWPIVHPTIMMRASALAQIGGYREEFYPNDDHDLFLRMAEIGEIENLPEVLLHYRKHLASISATNADRMTEMVGKVIIDACRRREIPVPAEVTQAQVRPSMRTVDVQRFWAWQAVKNHNISTARKYALATLWRRPLSFQSWRLTYCAVRGR